MEVLQFGIWIAWRQEVEVLTKSEVKWRRRRCIDSGRKTFTDSGKPPNAILLYSGARLAQRCIHDFFVLWDGIQNLVGRWILNSKGTDEQETKT